MAADCLIVVPTLGRRPAFLEQTLASIAGQDVAVDIVLVAPSDAELGGLPERYGCRVFPDPGSLPSAVNLGVAQAAEHHRFVNWLGDDDLLAPASLASTRQALLDDPSAVVAYGACEYIDEHGRLLWTSRAGAAARAILSWGPDLIPQPGMLVRADAWRAVGGLDETLRFAFDLDLLLKLRRVGRLIDVGRVVSCFRWHAESLTVSDRTSSLAESESVKRRHLSAHVARFAWTWEPLVRGATQLAARCVTRRSRRT